MAGVVIDVIESDGKKYVTHQDAARYLRMNFASVDFFASRGRIKLVQVGKLWLLDWESVQVFGRGLRGIQTDYETRFIRMGQGISN